MNLRSKFFKKPWQQRDEIVRAQAVRDEQDPELKAELPRLAQSDESTQVRLAALKRLNSEPFWLDARLREADGEIRQAADQFLAREVLRQDRPELAAARLEWLALVQDAELIRRIATASPSLDLRRAALQQISAQGFLGDCYGREGDDALAAELLARIDQISTLERVLQQTRKTNKQRAQAVAGRIEALKIASGQAVAGQSTSERLVQRAEKLARGETQGDLAAELQALRAEWDTSTDHPEPLALRFAGALKIIESALRRREALPTVPDQDDNATQTAEDVPTQIEAPGATPALAAAADFVRSAIRQGGSKGKAVSVRELLAHWDRAWNALPQASPADVRLKEEMLPLLRELQAQMQMQAQAKSAPAETAPAGSERVSLQPQLDRIAELLEGGDLGAVDEQLRELRRQFDRLPPRQRRSSDGGRLQRMEGRLKEMRNWQHWSNNQAREVLITQMEELAASGQHPDAVMARLKEARAEWSRLEALEVLPGDKRRFAAPPGQWRQFQAACKQAYDHSKPFLDKRQQLLKDNLEALKAFIQAGQEAAASPDSDIPGLLGFQRKARQAIRRMDDVPPKARGASAAALRELMNQLSAALDARFDAIEASKRRLVAEARTLSHEKDIKTAVDKAKALQSQWQKAGSGRRKVEQELWQAFREPIDPLFEQVKGEMDQRRQANEEARAELKQRCEQIEALADLPETELEEARGRLQGLIDDWTAQEQRPENLNRRFERAEQRFEQRLNQYLEKQRRGADQQLQQSADQLQALWSARSAGDHGDLAAQVTTPSQMEGLAAELRTLALRLADPDSDTAAFEQQAEANAELGRQIAVELEFLAGLDTPAADQGLRMDYQVQRLARRMSEREQRPDLASELELLMARWYRSLPQPPARHAELFARVSKARDILRGMAGL
ncbi:MAG: DUF349 domain-containing protein [Wenzhouxiangella sp.]